MKRFFILVFFTSSVIAVEPIQLKKHQTEPRYLIPVSPDGREYEAAVQRLLGNKWGKGHMICNGSAVGDLAVSVWGKGYKNYDHERSIDNFITLIKISRGKRGPISESQVNVPIDADFAVAVQRAWASMLLKTRYPQNKLGRRWLEC